MQIKNSFNNPIKITPVEASAHKEFLKRQKDLDKKTPKRVQPKGIIA